MKLATRILLGLLAGIALGAIARLTDASWLQRVVLAVEPIGTAFIRLITMVMVPLVVASLFVGVASLGDVRKLGRIGGKTLAYFFGTTLVAATIGVTVARLLRVGNTLDPSAHPELVTSLQVVNGPSLVETLLAMIPQNPFAAAAQADLLPLIVAVCIFGAAATVIRPEPRQALLAFFQALNDLCTVVLGWIMKIAPLAVLVLVAATITRAGAGLLQSLALFALAVLLALALHVSVVLLPLLRFGAGLGVGRFFRDVSDALLLAFSSASSNATLPVSMAAARERLGISSHIVSFVLPAGATMNKNGAAAYKAVTAVLIAQFYGLSLGVPQLITIVIASTLAGFAGTGVPGSSLVTTLIVLRAIGLGPEASAAVALVAGIDRPLDMCRTTVNTLGNLVGCAWIARTEGDALAAARPVALSAPLQTAAE